MTKINIKREIEEIRRQTKELSTSKEKATDFLIGAGILTRNGQKLRDVYCKPMLEKRARL